MYARFSRSVCTTSGKITKNSGLRLFRRNRLHSAARTKIVAYGCFDETVCTAPLGPIQGYTLGDWGAGPGTPVVPMLETYLKMHNLFLKTFLLYTTTIQQLDFKNWQWPVLSQTPMLIGVWLRTGHCRLGFWARALGLGLRLGPSWTISNLHITVFLSLDPH